MITNGNDGAGSITGDGFQTANYLSTADPTNGKYTAFGLITPAPGSHVEFHVDARYPKTGGDGLCKYLITSDVIESLTLEKPFEKWASTATIQDVTGKPVTVASNVQLQMVMDVAGPSKQSTLSIQVSDDTHGLWFSNNWTGLNTPVSATEPATQGGTIALH